MLTLATETEARHGPLRVRKGTFGALFPGLVVPFFDPLKEQRICAFLRHVCRCQSCAVIDELTIIHIYTHMACTGLGGGIEIALATRSTYVHHG